MIDFAECEACSKKPGAPVLCPSCLHNRQLAMILEDFWKVTTKVVEQYETHVLGIRLKLPTETVGLIVALYELRELVRPETRPYTTFLDDREKT